MGYDRLVAIGDRSWTDYEAEVHITVNEIEPNYASPSNGPALGLLTRWPGHTLDGFQPARQWWPMGAYSFFRWFQAPSVPSG
jgi:hypothetical protein